MLLDCLPRPPARRLAGHVVAFEPLYGLVEDRGGPVLALVHFGLEGRALIVLQCSTVAGNHIIETDIETRIRLTTGQMNRPTRQIHDPGIFTRPVQC